MIQDVEEKITEINLSLINSISFLVYEIENNDKNDLFILSKLLDEQSLINMINYYNGATIKLPTKLEYKRNLTLALYFYLMEIKGFTFNQSSQIMKEMSGFKIDEAENNIGKRLYLLKDKLKNRVVQMVEELKNG